MYSTLLGERKYYVCRVGVDYDAEKIENIIKIADVTYNFCKIKEDIQLCIDFDSTCNKFLNVSLSKKLENKIRSLRMDLS